MRLSGLSLATLTAGVLVLAPTLSGAQPPGGPPCGAGPETSGGTIIGTPCDDQIVALPGTLEILGGGGDDEIYASHAVRIVDGGDGNDTIFGEIPVPLETGATAAAAAAVPGATFSGGAGNDLIYATPWALEINGGEGDDLLYGEIPESVVGRPSPPPPPIPQGPPPRSATTSAATASASSDDQDGDGGAGAVCSPTTPLTYCGVGSQTFNGEAGNDVAFGQRGNDTMYGNAGDDQLFGGIGDEPLVSGGANNDLLSGGMGFDHINGDADSDLVRGDGTIDELSDTGSTGTDTVSFASGITPGFQADVVIPGTSTAVPGFPAPGAPERGVYVDLRPTSPKADNGIARYGGGNDTSFDPAGFENVVGTPFPDYIIGSTASNEIFGGGGADAIFAGDGDDSVIGGADGDHIDGGAGIDGLFGGGGDDYCTPASDSSDSCERSADGGVFVRNADSISVGFMNTDLFTLSYVDLYLTGSNTARDNVTAAYSTDPSGIGHVTFTAQADSATFDLSDDPRTAGCNYNSSREVVCDLPGTLDAIVLAGVGGNDNFSTSGFPATPYIVELGGEGSDTLAGDTRAGQGVEEMLVDGPESWADSSLRAFGGDDSLIANEGTDGLYGGDGNDLLLSASICDGDALGGGPGGNNASWARLGGSTGVIADLAAGTAGDQSGPSCGSGQLATLAGIVDLEGSNQFDGLFGGGGNNQLFGRPGQDSLYGRNGNDTILAHLDGQADTVNCGGGHNDTATVDDGDTYARTGCEVVNFR
jgi:Ca2+-binding RTX toxin-like protein